jgi:hypothetical protein
VLVPYSKYHVVGRPLGSTVPFSIAEVVVTAVTLPVVVAGTDDVVRMPSEPRPVPALLVATKR